jgi:hypothetical protein
VHAAGFIAVSRRFHSLARVLGDPYRTKNAYIREDRTCEAAKTVIRKAS